MSDVIRDVVVRITLEQINTALKVPDLAPVKAEYADVGKVAATSSAQTTKSISAIEAATKSAGLRQRELVKDISEAGKQGAKDYEALLKKRADAEKQVAVAAEAAAAKQTTAQLKVLDVTKQLGEGTFQLARGIAFLTTSGDEDFRVMLATIAKLQGGFDLIKGGATTIKGLVEGTKALQIATGAATVGQALLAGATGVVTAAASTATAAVTALKVALGPIGLIVTGIGVAAAAAGAAWHAMSSSGDELTETNTKLTASMERSLKLFQLQLEYAQKLRNINKESADANLSLLAGEEKLAALRGKQGANDVRQSVNGSLQTLEEQQAAAQRNAANNKGDNRTQFREFGLEQEKLAADIANRRLENAKQDVEYQRQIRDLKNQSAQAAENQLDKEKQIVETAKKGVDSAMQKLAIEEKKLQSFEAQFGALTKQEQLELRALSDKVKAGQELNRRELERAEQLGGEATRDFVQEQRAKAGKAAGAADAVSGFGDVTAGVSQAGRSLGDAISKQAEAESRAATAQAELEKATTALEAATELLRRFNKIAEQLGIEVAGIQKDLDTNKAQNE